VLVEKIDDALDVALTQEDHAMEMPAAANS
jgi:hypothetical protein